MTKRIIHNKIKDWRNGFMKKDKCQKQGHKIQTK